MRTLRTHRRSKDWGDGAARAFLGFIGLLLIGAGIGGAWLGSPARLSLVIPGLILVVMCAFYPTVSGEIRSGAIRLRFGGESMTTTLPDKHTEPKP